MAGPPKARKVTHGFGGHKMKSSFSSSDLLHKDPNSTTPAAVLQASPTSKTALYRLTYHLKDLSQLVVLEVETLSEVSKTPSQSKVERVGVEAGPGGKWELNESRKLRHKALSELLNDPSFDSIRDLATVNVGATRSTDHIILPASVKNNPEMCKALLPREIKLKMTKDVRITDTNGIQVYKQATKCVIVDARTCGEDRLPDVYWPSLDLVIRKRTTQDDPDSKFRTDSEFLQALPDSMKSWKNTQVDVVNPRNDPNEDYQTVIRKKLSLDRNNKNLHINFDLIVQFPKKNLQACLGDLFGGIKVETNIRDCFPVVERFLKGLRVRCRYIAPTEKDIKVGGKGTLLDRDNDPEKTQGRVFQIKSVKFPDDKEVENFTPAGTNTSMTVLEYFMKCMFTKNIYRTTEANHVSQISTLS
jgi:hypothetical protein